MDIKLGTRFKSYGIEYEIREIFGKNDSLVRISPVNNPFKVEVLPTSTVEYLINKNNKPKITLVDKLNMSEVGNKTKSNTILLSLTEEEFKFVKTWVELGMKYEEINNLEV